MTEQINEAGYKKGIQILTEKEQRSKDKLQEFIKDHPILKQQEKFERMEKALILIGIGYHSYYDGSEEIITSVEMSDIAREALKEN